MTLDKKLVQKVHQLNKFVDENTAQYFHSRPLVVSKSGIVLPDRTKHPFEMEYSLKELLLIGALTQSPVLLTGGTDLGKTALARLVMNSQVVKAAWLCGG